VNRLLIITPEFIDNSAKLFTLKSLIELNNVVAIEIVKDTVIENEHKLIYLENENYTPLKNKICITLIQDESNHKLKYKWIDKRLDSQLFAYKIKNYVLDLLIEKE